MTTKTGDRIATTSPIDESDVLAYLRTHRDMLVRNPQLLTELDIPHETGTGAVSLIERQVAVLREENDRLNRRLAVLLQNARDNERVGARLLALGRGLLEADSLDAVLSLVREALLTEFSADSAAVRLIDDGDGARAAREPERFLALDGPEIAPFRDCLDKVEPRCGDVDRAAVGVLLQAPESPPASAAVVPLSGTRPVGLIVLGSEDPKHFHRDMGTHFLAQLGELVTAGVLRHRDGD